MDEEPIAFPLKGVDQSRAFVRQTGETTPLGVNVRAYEPIEDRKRGGSRPGLARWIDDKVGTGPIQGLGCVVSIGVDTIFGYFPFVWPGFVVNPQNFGPVRNGGNGEQSMPGIVPLITWAPGSTSLYHDQAFGGTHLDAGAKDPRNNNPLAGTFTYTPPSGTVFGDATSRVVTVLFVPNDPTTFRRAQSQFTFTLKVTPTYVDWSPTTSVTLNTVLDGTILDGVGRNKDDNTLIAAGTVYYDLYDPAGIEVGQALGQTLDQPSSTYTVVAMFLPDDTKKYKASRLTVQFTTDDGGGGTGPPFTFTSIDLFFGFVFDFAASTCVITDVGGHEVSRIAFGEIKPALYDFLVAGGYDGGTTWPGPVNVIVPDNTRIDGGDPSQVTWHFQYP